MSRTIVAGLTGVLAFAHVAHAQDWPTRPITLVVPFAAGGAVDVVARIIAPPLGDALGQQIVIENIGGAGGMTGSARVAKGAPDGYLGVLGSAGTHAQNQTLYKKPLYRTEIDFEPVALMVEQPIVLVTRKDFPVENLKEFIVYAKANEATLKFGSAGAGSANHLACILLNAAIGINPTHVPYRGGGPAMQDLVAGRIDYGCNLAPSALPQIDGKTIKALAMLTRTRSPIAPDIATAHEQGLADFEAYSWNGIVLPKGTPAPIVTRFARAIDDVLNVPAVVDRLKTAGVTAVSADRRSPEYFAKFIHAEIEKWAAAIKASGLSVD
jgi:tripartite-type tricarboxylate transporter receptor subunit TctC